ncbi:MAG: sulfurtransferase [Erythrobacter sp.]|uniref:sulfurtransferase n=1 Tax=Erythrobacter sp. TaxID=1042 RepID=UPI0032EE477F
MQQDFPSLVSSEWLAGRLEDPALAVLDASRHLPASGRNPRTEYEAAHIPGARFLDLASLTDPASDVPAALPTAEQVAARLAALGVGPQAAIVLYDDSAVKTSARAWFALSEAGRERVAILDGGLAKWRAEGRPLESGPHAAERAETDVLHAPRRVRTKADMLANCDSRAEQVLDARGADRVFGTGEDPVHGGANGRIPGSLNLPFDEVFAEDGTFKPAPELRAAFEAAGVDLSRPVVTTCGSGVTASVLLFALHLTGKHDAALYDGSWMEWSADPDTPKAQGPEA